jgi:hypothetical protein
VQFAHRPIYFQTVPVQGLLVVHPINSPIHSDVLFCPSPSIRCLIAIRLPKYMHTKILMYSFIRQQLLMDVTSTVGMPLQPGCDNDAYTGKKKLGESGCHVRTIGREPRIPRMQGGMRVRVAAGRREANTEGRIGPSHLETNKN